MNKEKLNLEKTKEEVEEQENKELMGIPEVKFEINHGYFWYSLLQRVYNQEWEKLNNKSQINKEIGKNLSTKKIDLTMKQQWNDFVDKVDNNEILFWFSLANENKELTEKVFEDCERYKDLRKNAVQKLFKEFNDILNHFKIQHKDLWNIIKNYLKKDISLRKKKQEEKEIIQDSLEYFQPKKETTNIQEVIYLPTNPLVKKTKGSGFKTKDKGMIVSNIENSQSKRHEFLHFIINPITEKIDFTDDEKEKIIAMAGKKLILDQGYGEHAHSLLNEILIRTFCSIKENKKPINFDEFNAYINNLSEKNFEKIKKENISYFSKLKIDNLSDLKNKAREIYNRKIKNVLGEKIYALYQKFEKESKKRPNLTFEDYFLENYQKIFD